jgi:PAS domain S-box-containing protein
VSYLGVVSTKPDAGPFDGQAGCGGASSSPGSTDAALSAERYEAVLSSITDGVFTVDASGRITCFNRAAERITGFTREQALGKPCREIFRSSICQDACALRYTMETGSPIVDLMVHIQNVDGEEIPVSISTALFRDKDGELVGGVESFRDLRQVEALRARVKERYRVGDIVTKNAELRQLLDTLPTIATSDSTVLVTGESGTGKELVARAIHASSSRPEGPFVAVNSAGIPDTLLEAELFGYEAGAFTGAVKAKPGRLARAEGGTLFLDEIGDLPMQLQAKLLRVLQDRVFEPLGGTAPKHADVRFLAATNRDLDEMVAQGDFRQDLYYRIKVFELRLPPLRERMGDVPLLIDHFIERLSHEHDKRVLGVSPEALKILMSHDYPGNVRELENAVEHGFVLAGGSLIHPEHLPAWVKPATPPPMLNGTLEDLERAHIIAALEANDFNRLAAARQLGIHKTTLFRKIRKLGIELPGKDGRSAPKR